MIIEYEIVSPKTQTKMNDCWYACIQMLRSTIMGVKSKPQGDVTLGHRDKRVVGRKLSFGDDNGKHALLENQLVDVSGLVNFNDLEGFGDVLLNHGPLIACGKFAFFNKFGHCIVISGCNTQNGMVTVYDPGWGEGRQTKPWDYIGLHCERRTDYPQMPRKGSFVANRDWPDRDLLVDL